MIESKSLILFTSFLSVSISIASSSDPVISQPQENRSFKIRDSNHNQYGYGCSYTVRIKTSCASPPLTRDAISIAFGDAYRNEIYAPRLDDPSSRAFERCSTDTFKIAGPCGYGVCYLYLRRQGWDGWTPEWVQIFDPAFRGRGITFYYGGMLPNAVWFGFDHCPRFVPMSVDGVGGKRTDGDRISEI